MTEECTKEHQRDIWLSHPEHSVVAAHTINRGHWIQFDNMTAALTHLPHYTSRVNCKSFKITLHNYFNREGGYQVSPGWKNIIHTLKEQRGNHCHTQTTNPSPGPVTAASPP
jgi:hypothetical protein